MIVLNVGGGGRTLPERYTGWDQCLLDIDPAVGPDICLDAKDLLTLEAGVYDAVHCSHTLEHFYQHDVPAVLAGFLHVLAPNGVVDIAVPNLNNLIDEMRGRNLDINDVWYRAGTQPITFHDVLYGWSVAMKDGNLFYAHKCGFTAQSLATSLQRAGFGSICTAEVGPNLFAKAYREVGVTCQ